MSGVMPDWCPSCGTADGVHILSQYRDGGLDSCVACGEEAAGGHALCPVHQAETETELREYLPILLAHLERVAGAEVDAYIERGRLAAPRWWLGPDVSALAHVLADRLFDAYADEELDARLLYGTRAPSDPDDPRPYLSIEGLDPPAWFVDHVAPIFERAIREAFATLPTVPVERAAIREAARRETSEGLGTPYEMVFGYLGTNDPPLSEDARDLVSFRYDRAGGAWFWFGWDEPNACWLRSGILPPPLAARLRLVCSRWGSDSP